MIVANRDWLEPTTLARTVDATLPLGKVYVPDGSYREMTEWVLTPALHQQYEQARKPWPPVRGRGSEAFLPRGGLLA